MLRGGEAISGAEGCVTIPSLVVERGSQTRNVSYVTKLFYDEKSYNDEKSHNDMVLKNVDPNGTFTSAKYDESPIDLSKITPAESNDCPNLVGKDLKILKYVNYKYLGRSIQDIIDKSISFNNVSSRDIIRALANLSVKIESMNNAGFYHNDVHGGNIMYDQKVEYAYLIDFGHLGTSKNKLIDLQGILSATRSIAVHLASQSKVSIKLKSILKLFINDVAPVLAKTQEATDDKLKEAQYLIMKTLSDFSNVYTQAEVGGRRKTLRRRH
jgi:serine/threonine protein kinase